MDVGQLSAIRETDQVVAVLAPNGTTLEVPEPDLGVEYGTRRFRWGWPGRVARVGPTLLLSLSHSHSAGGCRIIVKSEREPIAVWKLLVGNSGGGAALDEGPGEEAVPKPEPGLPSPLRAAGRAPSAEGPSPYSGPDDDMLYVRHLQGASPLLHGITPMAAGGSLPLPTPAWATSFSAAQELDRLREQGGDAAALMMPPRSKPGRKAPRMSPQKLAAGVSLAGRGGGAAAAGVPAGPQLAADSRQLTTRVLSAPQASLSMLPKLQHGAPEMDADGWFPDARFPEFSPAVGLAEYIFDH